MATKVINQIRNCERATILADLWNSDDVSALIREEHLQATPITPGQQAGFKPWVCITS
jgi:hypothetical protein